MVDALVEKALGGCGTVEACAAAKGEGNAAYAVGNLDLAAGHYSQAIELWQEALDSLVQPQVLEVSQLVQYDRRCYFGVVMSAFTLFDEYFLKDLGSNQAIWVGDPGGNLRRFARKELKLVPRNMLDLRLAVAQNLAAVYLKQGKLEEAVRWADAALVIEGRAPKALLRKGAALLRMNRSGPASDVLATALEVTPGDSKIRRLLREAEARRSPTWVCVTGCCGPWGIVCGGPAASIMAEVVPPARRPVTDDTLAKPDSARDGYCSSCASSAPPSPRGLDSGSRSPLACESGPMSAEGATSEPAADNSAEPQASTTEAIQATKAKQAPYLWWSLPSPSPLLGSPRWMGTASILLTSVVVAWMFGEPWFGSTAVA